ncbi:TPA: hypothetical protein RSW73_003737 [Vibrio cholerae]|nr:hypothetical protein [Vibrio cholerae]EJL6763172.1 hypothetical protein [Vibrio cholerae]EJL6849118.1 hypothetical protein [Vibrio cholerae]EJL6980430.1 hypothetical protein [Vibrio cholerae]EJL7002307.1 hypothetical protein [Vibrio cholerae]
MELDVCLCDAFA